MRNRPISMSRSPGGALLCRWCGRSAAAHRTLPITDNCRFASDCRGSGAFWQDDRRARAARFANREAQARADPGQCRVGDRQAQPAARRGLALAAYETLAQRRGVRIGQAAALVVDHHPRLAAGEGERRRDTLAFGTIDSSEEHTSELQSLMRTSYSVFCLKKKQSHMYLERTH